MAKTYSDIRKFKKLESELRKVTVSLSKALKEIELAKEGRNSEEDIQALSRAQASWAIVHAGAKQALAHFWDDVGTAG